MSRVKSFQATGLAPLGKVYAGDLNAIQDHYADLSNYTQTVGVGTLQVGEGASALLLYATGDVRLTAALRTDGIIRALGGLYLGAFTTAARDAIGVGLAPYGIKVFNTTTNRFEWNSGTDVARVWRPEGFNGAGAIVFPDATTQITAAVTPEVDMGLLVAMT
jgi:hypothetical protein